MYRTMAFHNMAFAGDDFDKMDDFVNDYTETEAKLPRMTQKPSGCFTFIDFCPEYRRKPDAWFFQAEYEPFRFVMICVTPKCLSFYVFYANLTAKLMMQKRN